MMKKMLLLVALLALTIGLAFADFPEMKFELPATYLPKITQASQMTSVRIAKNSWSDKQNLQLVEGAEKAYLLNLESDEQLFATDAVVSGTGGYAKITYTFPEPTVNGEYEVIIPAGTIETVDGKELNPEISYVYTLEDPKLAVTKITPVTLTPPAGTALMAVNNSTGIWTVAFDPEIQKNAGYMKVVIEDADKNHMYEDEPFYSQIQINRRERLDLDQPLDKDLTQPFSFTWGGKSGSGVMYQGYEYKCTFEVRESEYNEARDGKGKLLGMYECTYKGNTMPEQYADIHLAGVGVSPTPKNFDKDNPDGYAFETTSDPHITFYFDKPVEPNTSLCAINTGSGTSVPFEGSAENFNDGKEWRFTIPKSRLEPPSILAFFAFTDPETSLPVKGNNGRGALSTFSYEWTVEIGLPTLSVVTPEPLTELKELSRITLSNNENYFFLTDGGASEKATLSTKQGETVYTFNYSKIEFNNTEKTATLIVDPAITTDGTYVLTVPKGYFTLANNAEVEQMETTYQNKLFTTEFFVKGEEEPITLNAKYKYCLPENGSKVESIKSAEVFFDIPSGSYASQNYDFTGEKPVLKNEAGDKVADIDVEFGSVDSSLMVAFKPEVTAPGKYSITFPDKFFYEDQTNNYTPEFSLSWTIEGSGTLNAKLRNAVPENESTVKSLNQVALFFDLPVDSYIAPNYSFAGEQPVLKDAGGNQVATVDVQMGEANNEMDVTFSPVVTAPGVYSITFPERYFIEDETSNYSPEFTLTWTIAENLAKLSVVSPEPETDLTEISRITLKNDADLYFADAALEGQKATLSTKQGGVVFEFGNDTFEYDKDTKTISLMASPAVTAPGAYVLMIPEGFFLLADDDDPTPTSITMKNAAFEAEFYVKEAENPDTFNAVLKSSDPENGSTVKSLKEVEVFFDIPEGTFMAQDYDMEKPVLKNKAGEEAATIDVTFAAADNGMKIIFNPEITAPGEYSIAFPDKFFYQDGSNNYTPAFTLSWTIAEPETMNAIFKSSNPENGSKVSALKDIEVFFEIPEGSFMGIDTNIEKPVLKNAAGDKVCGISTNFGSADNSVWVVLDEKVTEPGEYSIAFPDKFFYEFGKTNYTPAFTLNWTIEKAPEIAYDLAITATPENNTDVDTFGAFSFNFDTEVVLTDGTSSYKAVMTLDGEEKANTMMSPSADNKAFEGTFAPEISAFGVYSMTIAMDTFRSNDGLHANAETTFSWTIGKTGISAIRYVDGVAGDVYTLTGTLVVHQATEEDINRLEPGIYLIGGQKYLVK